MIYHLAPKLKSPRIEAATVTPFRTFKEGLGVIFYSLNIYRHTWKGCFELWGYIMMVYGISIN